jgi:hypothetical protein
MRRCSTPARLPPLTSSLPAARRIIAPVRDAGGSLHSTPATRRPPVTRHPLRPGHPLAPGFRGQVRAFPELSGKKFNRSPFPLTEAAEWSAAFNLPSPAERGTAMSLLSQLSNVSLLKKAAVAGTAACALVCGQNTTEAGYGDQYRDQYRVQVHVTTRTTTSRTPVCRPVTTYQTRYEPVVSTVTRYDHCGRPYRVNVVSYRTVRVPVMQYVRGGH